jgi:hypothetical protein
MTMPRDNSGPPCPKPPRIRELIDLVGENVVLSAVDEHDLIDALDWLATSLENRTLYHKRQQVKNKVLRQLAHEYGIDDQANVITNDTMHTLVSNQPPNASDILDLEELKKLQENTNEDK